MPDNEKLKKKTLKMRLRMQKKGTSTVSEMDFPEPVQVVCISVYVQCMFCFLTMFSLITATLRVSHVTVEGLPCAHPTRVQSRSRRGARQTKSERTGSAYDIR